MNVVVFFYIVGGFGSRCTRVQNPMAKEETKEKEEKEEEEEEEEEEEKEEEEEGSFFFPIDF